MHETWEIETYPESTFRTKYSPTICLWQSCVIPIEKWTKIWRKILLSGVLIERISVSSVIIAVEYSLSYCTNAHDSQLIRSLPLFMSPHRLYHHGCVEVTRTARTWHGRRKRISSTAKDRSSTAHHKFINVLLRGNSISFSIVILDRAVEDTMCD